MEPRNRFQGMNSASLSGLAGRYDNSILPWFLSPVDFLKIPAQIIFWFWKPIKWNQVILYRRKLVLNFLVASLKRKINLMFLLASLKTLTNFKTCFESHIKILCQLSFTLIGWVSQLWPAYGKFFRIIGAFGTTFRLPGGYQKAGRSSLRG